jgi:hypothetical protein
MASTDNTITPILNDVRVMRAVVDAGVTVNDMVLRGVWRSFFDVELNLPLPVMPLNDQERNRLAKEIIHEMEALFSELEELAEGLTEEAQFALGTTEEARRINSLWRELAGVYAEQVNEQVPVIPAALREIITARIVSDMAEKFGVDEDDIRNKIRTESTLRMMLRMQGIDPDELGDF